MNRTLLAFGLAAAFAVPFSARAEQEPADPLSGAGTTEPAEDSGAQFDPTDDSFEAVRARVAADPSLRVRSLEELGLSPSAVPREFHKIEDLPTFDGMDEAQLVVPTISPAGDDIAGLLGAFGTGAGGGKSVEYEVDALSGFFGERTDGGKPDLRTGRKPGAPAAEPARPKPARPKPGAARGAGRAAAEEPDNPFEGEPNRNLADAPPPAVETAPQATPRKKKVDPAVAAALGNLLSPKPAEPAPAAEPAPPATPRKKKVDPAVAAALGNLLSPKPAEPAPAPEAEKAGSSAGSSNWPFSIGLFPPLQIVGSSCDVDPGIRIGVLWTEHANASGLGISGGVAWTTGDMAGIHVAGLWSCAEGDFSGLSFASLQNRVDGNGRGIGLSALSNVADAFSGLQLSLFNVVDELYGIQIGLYNGADAARGLQIGVFNAAGRMSGLQIGLSNYIEAGSVPWLPVFNASLSF